MPDNDDDSSIPADRRSPQTPSQNPNEPSSPDQSEDRYDQIPRSIEFVLGLNPVAAFLFSLICALSLFGLAKEQALTLQSTTELLGWINIILVAAWAACCYLGFIISSVFPQIYVVLSVVNVAVSGFVLVRQRMMGDFAPYGLLALVVTLYLVACVPLLYSQTAEAVFDKGQTTDPDESRHRRMVRFIRDLFWS